MAGGETQISLNLQHLCFLVSVPHSGPGGPGGPSLLGRDQLPLCEELAAETTIRSRAQRWLDGMRTEKGNCLRGLRGHMRQIGLGRVPREGDPAWGMVPRAQKSSGDSIQRQGTGHESPVDPRGRPV